MKSLRYSLIVVALAASANMAAAQVPRPRPPVKPPRDTTQQVPVPQDSAQQPQDSTTTRQEPVIVDSVYPIPQLATFNYGPANGFSSGIWTWDRNALQLEGAATLADLLERLPSVLVLRAGYFLQQEAVAPLGGTANRVEVWVDGFAIDPFFESSFDFSRLPLAEIESVRVERRLGRTRIYIETLTSRDSRPYSVIEAAVGEPQGNLFRGVFLAPKVFAGPLGVAIDRMDTDGRGGDEPADMFSGWAKYSFIRKGSGLQVEYRRSRLNRGGSISWGGITNRTDLIARLRVNVADGLTAELFGGQTRLDWDTATVQNDTIPKIETDNLQLGGRIGYSSPLFWARGSYRIRDHEALPKSELDGAAGFTYRNILNVAGEFTQTDYRAVGSGSEYTLRAEVGPFMGFRFFGETSKSDRGAPWLTLPPDSTPFMNSVEGIRAGVALDWKGISAGGALLKLKSDSAVTFGFPVETRQLVTPGADATGVEATARIPLYLIKGIYAIGSITDYRSGNVGLYTPPRTYRAGLELYTVPLKSGNLEILGRIEAIYRGVMSVPNVPTEEDGQTFVRFPGGTVYDGYLQIRIMDVRAFVRYEDLSNQDIPDFPDRVVGGPRVFYGVKWQFFN